MKKVPRLQNKKSSAAANLLKSSSVLSIKRFQKKADDLREHCMEKGIFRSVAENGEDMPCPFAVFVSVGNPSVRAVVRCAVGKTPEEAWDAAVERMNTFLRNNSFEVQYVKMDLVDQGQWFPLETVNDILDHAKKNFWRCGLAFDREFRNVFLEVEQNTQRLVRYDKHGVFLQKINEFLLERGRPQMFRLPDEVLVFSCQAVFSDEDDSIHVLYDEGYGYGRRKIEAVDEPLLRAVLSTAGQQLANMEEADGRFQYEYFADQNTRMSTYSILRQIAALCGMLMSYEREPERELLEKIEKAIGYALQNALQEKDGTAYMVEKDEMKLSANAGMAVVLLTYMEVTGKETYLPLVKKLGEGILQCQHTDGAFWHLYSYPALERNEKQRVLYYDGEAAFALAKLYGFTKEEKWLQSAERAIAYFIEKDYMKYTDHWVAYALNEVTKYQPKEAYFAFALKNVEHNLDKIYQEDISHPAYLELLMASFETLQRLKEAYPQLEEWENFDEKQFITVLYHRAQHALSGYLYPEYAMYLKKPAAFIGSFCLRQENFRVRVDDIACYIGGYHLMLKNMAALEECRCRLDIAHEDYLAYPEDEEEGEANV